MDWENPRGSQSHPTGEGSEVVHSHRSGSQDGAAITFSHKWLCLARFYSLTGTNPGKSWRLGRSGVCRLLNEPGNAAMGILVSKVNWFWQLPTHLFLLFPFYTISSITSASLTQNPQFSLPGLHLFSLSHTLCPNNRNKLFHGIFMPIFRHDSNKDTFSQC